MINRAELHCHTKMSELSGITDVKDLIRKAQNIGISAIAITDRDSVQAFPRASEELQRIINEVEDEESVVKILYGMEAVIVDDVDCVVSNDKGQNLNSEYVVLDLETTGLSPVTDKIIEIGAVRIKDGKICDSFSSFVNPERHIPKEVTALTGISDEMVSSAENVDKVFPKLIDFCENSILVAHNAPFDISFIEEEMTHQKLCKDFTVLDTLSLSRMLLNNQCRCTLVEVAKELGVKQEGFHRALNDAMCTAEILLRYLDMLKDLNINTLNELINYSLGNYNIVTRMPWYRTILIARNHEGLRNLYEISTIADLTYNKRIPRIPMSLLSQKREGLLVGSCAAHGQVSELVCEKASTKEIRKAASFYDFIEVEPVCNYQNLDRFRPEFKSERDVQSIIKEIVSLGTELSIPVIASSNVYYENESDLTAYKVLKFAQGWSDAKDWNIKHHLMSTTELLEEFDFLGKESAYEIVVENTLDIMDDVDSLQPIPREKRYPEYPNAYSRLENICFEKAREKYGKNLPYEVKSRLDFELSGIKRHNYASIYMIALEYTGKVSSTGFMYAIRNNMSASLVAYLIGISELNPLKAHYFCKECFYTDFILSDIKKDSRIDIGLDLPDKKCPLCGTQLSKSGFNLPVESFLGYKLDKEPSIDFLFSLEHVKEAQNLLQNISGEGRILCAGATPTLDEATARKYFRKYNIDCGTQHELTEIPQKLVGTKKCSNGKIPGRFFIIPTEEDVYKYTPIAEVCLSEIPKTHFDYRDLATLFMDVSILSHSSLSMLETLSQQTGTDGADISLSDKNIMSLFTGTNSLGITPEQICNISVGTLGERYLGRGVIRRYIEKFAPKEFEDIVKIISLSLADNDYRNYFERHCIDNPSAFKLYFASREDIMFFLIDKGICHENAYRIMERVRMGMFRDNRILEEWIDELQSHDVPDWYINALKHVRYLPTKAQSVQYALLSWRILYFKLYYPEAFYQAWYENVVNEIDEDFIGKGKDYAIEVYNTLSNKNPRKLGWHQQDLMDEIPILMEMKARGITI